MCIRDSTCLAHGIWGSFGPATALTETSAVPEMLLPTSALAFGAALIGLVPLSFVPAVRAALARGR